MGLDATAEGMTRLLVATKEMGTAQSVLEQVHKNIVILGRAGGTSTEEMKGAMRQLSQGLASGRLQGEELRSVLENLPLVAIEIAKQMGIGLGQIRKVAKEGKISGQVVVDALSEIEITMKDLPRTWAMQTENLRTEWTLFLNDLSQAVDEAGLLESLSEAVKWVRFNMLGSFYGKSTDDLMARMAQIKTEQGLLKQNADKATDEWRIKRPIVGAAGQEWMAGMEGDGAQTGARNIQELTEEYRKLNEEVERRIKLDKMAKDAAAARTAMDDFAAQSKLIKEISLIDAGDRIEAMWKRINKHFETIGETIKDKIGGPMKVFLDSMREAKIVLSRGIINLEQFQEYRRILKDELIPTLETVKDTTDELSEYAKRAAQNIQDAFADFLFDPFEKGVKGMLESFLTAIRRMIAEQMAVSILGDPKKGGGLGGFIGSIFGMASGGPVAAGRPYMVGEMGPELFVPSSSGSILANGAGGVVVNQNYHIEAGADWGTLQRILPPLFDRNRQETVAEIRNRINEGSL